MGAASALQDLEYRLTEMKLTGQKREDRIFIGNIAPQMTEDEIRALFSQTAYKISEVRIITEPDRGIPGTTRAPRRYAFVTFERKEDVAAALKEFQGQQLIVHGRKLVVAEAYKMAPHTRQYNHNVFPFLAGGMNPYNQYRWAQAAVMPRTMMGFPAFQHHLAMTENALMGFPIIGPLSPSVPSSPNPCAHPYQGQAGAGRMNFGDGYLPSAGILPSNASLFDFPSVPHMNNPSGPQGMKYQENGPRVPVVPNNYSNFLVNGGRQAHSHAGVECSGCILHTQQVQEDAMRYQSQSASAPAFWKQSHASIG
jgi:RNA recognition motif-containing protein